MYTLVMSHPPPCTWIHAGCGKPCFCTHWETSHQVQPSGTFLKYSLPWHISSRPEDILTTNAKVFVFGMDVFLTACCCFKKVLVLFCACPCAGWFLFVLTIWILAKRQGFPIPSLCLLLFQEDSCAGLCLCLSWFVLVCTCYFNPSEKGLGFWVLWSHVVLWQKVILSDKSNPKTHRQYNPKNNKSNPKSNPKK